MSILTTLKIKFELWWLGWKMRRRIRKAEGRSRPGVYVAAFAAVASLIFLASVVFGADAYTGLSGRPSTQRATVTW